MAYTNFYGSIDLLKLKGARLLSGIDQKNPKMNFVCIPVVNYSGVALQQARDGHGYRAQLQVNMWALPDSYRQKAVQNRMSRGEDVSTYNPPSHSLEVNYTEEFRARAMEAAKKRILKEHPDWENNPQHEKELTNAIYDAVRIKLGNITASMSAYTQQSSAPVATAAAQPPTDYIPPQTDANGNPLDDSYQGDDLPF